MAKRKIARRFVVGYINMSPVYSRDGKGGEPQYIYPVTAKDAAKELESFLDSDVCVFELVEVAAKKVK